MLIARRKRLMTFIQGLGKSNPPDVVKIEQGENHLVFICDDLMNAHKNNPKLQGSKMVHRAFTADHFEYRIGKHTGKGLPFRANRKAGLKVKGEIYAANAGVMKALDNHYDQGVQFARVRVPVIVTARDHRLISIGSEEFLKELPPGNIRTVPELNKRHYLSNPQACVVNVFMYVALRVYWIKEGKGEEDNNFPVLHPKTPQQPLVWLNQYYKYPIDRNRPVPLRE